MDVDIAAYCARIGVSGPLPPTAATLRRLHHAHMLAVPFENLDIHWGRPIVLEEARLFEKLVTRSRGGFCYEQNGLFALVLRELGFTVDLLEARVGAKPWEDSLPWDHMTLQVTLKERWLVDVGFGDGFREPLLLDEARPQARSDGIWRVQHDGCEGLHSSRTTAGDWKTEYRFRLRPRHLVDFTPGCEHHQHSPESHFTQQRLCSIATKTGRITLSDRCLIETEGFPSRAIAGSDKPENARRQERDLADEAEFLQLLRERFGIEP
ncbi:MAG: arylamine N-acetyltransferase [Gemmatimonadetes bacterium]|nr:arylamine N-acetyltransferase [Gemmatimonadota bacterium]